MIFAEWFPLYDITVGERSRQSLRNIDSLARSMDERGLLSPVYVRRTSDGYVLICGGRRLEAARRLGWEGLPVLVAEDDIDEKEALLAEGDENTEREPFTVAEAVEHRRRIREIEARSAKRRQGTRTDLGGELPHNLYEGSGGRGRTVHGKVREKRLNRGVRRSDGEGRVRWTTDSVLTWTLAEIDQNILDEVQRRSEAQYNLGWMGPVRRLMSQSGAETVRGALDAIGMTLEEYLAQEDAA